MDICHSSISSSTFFCPFGRSCDYFHASIFHASSYKFGCTVEYIDAADAGDHIIYDRHVRAYAYIRSLTAKDIGNLEKLIDEPYICRWPEEWTNKVNAMKKSGEMGDEARRLKMRRQVRILNCMKMYGLGTTSRGYMIVRDHKSRGEPIFVLGIV